MVFFSRQSRHANLLINDACIQYVELVSTDPLLVHQYGERALPAGVISDGRIADEKQFASIMKNCIEEWKLKRKKVRFVLPDSLVIIRTVKIPNELKADEVKGYLIMEIGESIHLPFEEAAIDYVDLKSKEASEKERSIILFASPESDVAAYIRIFKEAKLKPIAVDIMSLCHHRFLSFTRLLQPEKPLLLVHLHLHTITFTIFEEGNPLFLKYSSFPVQLAEWNSRISNENQRVCDYQLKNRSKEEYLNSLEEQISELPRISDFYQYSMSHSQKKLTEIFVTGDHPYLPDIAEALKSKTEISVKMANTPVTYSKNFQQMPEKFQGLLGLSLKEVKS